jgi:undecaprenol kinase
MNWRKFGSSLRHAWQGVRELVYGQQNIRIELALAILAIAVTYFLGIRGTEKIIIFVLILFVLSAEVINSIFEATLDGISKSFNPRWRKAKDMMAGFTLLLALGSLVIALIIFYPYFITWLKRFQ